MHKRHSAFTLVELLVVITVLGVLIGLMLPAIQAARHSAWKTACQNNLKQIACGIHQFAEAHQRIPRQPWTVPLLPHLGQGNQSASCLGQLARQTMPVYLCGAADVELVEGKAGGSFLLNAELTGSQWELISDGLSQTAMLGEAQQQSPWILGPETAGSNLAGSLHAGGANVAFADGHVKFLPQSISVGVQAWLWDPRDNQVIDGHW